MKIEGAGPIGYRTTFVGGVRDRILVSQIDNPEARSHAHPDAIHAEMASCEAQFIFHTDSKNGVTGPFEPLENISHALCGTRPAVPSCSA
ncbi:hypothetical protein [Paraburkholderia sp. DGU8]|uniref:hypothetical protein n=1 Tax=Paraburkholderia sp. DGU8 TaxID=3161997 RepID=UPI00346693B6